MKLIKYKRRPKIPPLFLPLQNERSAEFLRHLLLMQCDFAFSYLTDDETTVNILESLLKVPEQKAPEENENEKKDDKSKKEKDKKDKKDKKKKEKEKKEKEKKEKKEKKKAGKKEKNDDINQDPNYFELPPIPVLTPEEEEEQKKRHAKKIFRWCVECFLNRLRGGATERPEVPIDYSSILPEFRNVNTLYAYAQMPSDDLSKVYQAYPYDFFNVCSKMTPKFANDFIIACLFNRKVPIPIGARLISIFPLTQIQIDYTLVYEKRCRNFRDMSSLFEGLLCNTNNQLKAAEILAGDYEKNVFNDECVTLINSSIRGFSHFIDKDINTTIELFPSGQTISFLIQTATTPLAELSKRLKTAQPNEYITRLTNQITLLELLNLSEDWSKLETMSVPALLEHAYKGERFNPEILFELPRNSIFFTYSTRCWEIDFDFIQAFVALQTMLSEHRPIIYPSYLNYDLFSLLFMLKPPKNAGFATPEDEKMKGQESDQINDNNKDIMDYVGKQKKNSDFYYDIESALGIVQFMQKNGHPPEDLKSYLESADRKLRSAMVLYESPTINDALMTKEIYYMKSLKSLDWITKISEIYGNPPRHVSSKRFSLTVMNKLGIDNVNVTKTIPLYGRVIPGQTINDKVDTAVSQVLTEFPIDIHVQLVLDFASSHKKLPLLTKKLESDEYAPYLNDVYLKFIKKIQINCRKYPNPAALSLGDSRSIFDYKKRLSGIISCHMANSNLDRFARYLYALITIKSQSFYKFHNVRPQGQMQVLFNTIESLASLREKMVGTGIEPIQFLLKKNRPDLCSPSFFEKAVGEDPMIFIPFAQNSVEPAKLASFIKQENFNRVKRYFEVCKVSAKSQAAAKDQDSLMAAPGPEEAATAAPPPKQAKQPHPEKKSPASSQQPESQKADEKSKPADDKEKDEDSAPIPSASTADSQGVLQILHNLENIEDKEERMNVLEDLLYNNKEISKYTSNIIEIIQFFPQVWVTNFIETFITLVEPEDSALIQLLEFLAFLNPKQQKNLETASEITRVQTSYDYLTRIISNFDDVIERPQDFFRLCNYHLKSHLVEREMISCLRYFCLILICVRNYKLFKTKEKESEWISRYVTNGASSITTEIVGQMIVDIGLNSNFDCGKRLAELCPEIDLSPYIKKTMPNSVKLLSYVKDPSSLVTSILSEQKVGSEADEVRLLHFLAKIGSIHLSPSFANSTFNANNIPLFKILNEYAHIYICYRRRIRYAGQSLRKLYDISVMTDTLSIIPIFKENNVEMSPIVKTMVENSYTIFGLVPNRNHVEAGKTVTSSPSSRRKIFTTPKLTFNINDRLTEMSKTLSSSSDQPTMYMIESTQSESNYLTVYQVPLQKRDIKINYKPDFSYYEMQDKFNSKILKIGIGSGNNAGTGITLENLATESFSANAKISALEKLSKLEDQESSKPTEQIKFMNMANMRKTISDYVGHVNLNKLFESLPNQHLHTLLKFANAKGLIHMIYKLCCWVEDHEEAKKVFIFPRSSFKEFQDNTADFKKKLNEFISTLKNVLLKALALTPYVDSSNLLPVNILVTGNTKLLKDDQTLIEFQIELDVRKVNLFANKTNKTGLIMKLFYEGEYEKAFTMIRIFRIDMNQILSKTVKVLIDNESDMSKIGKFMFNVVPRLDIDSANKLIESISSYLSKNEANKPFLNLLVSGIDDSRNVYQMLSNFGFNETAAMVAIQEGLGEEVSASFNDQKNKNQAQLLRSCSRWLNQNKSQMMSNE